MSFWEGPPCSTLNACRRAALGFVAALRYTIAHDCARSPRLCRGIFVSTRVASDQRAGVAPDRIPPQSGGLRATRGSGRKAAFDAPVAFSACLGLCSLGCLLLLFDSRLCLIRFVDN